MKQRQMEYQHHGDPLVPTAATLRPVHALADEGARSARTQSVRAPARRRAGNRSDRAAHRFRDLDKLGLLNGVTTFNFHLHLPHYALTAAESDLLHVLARQPIDLSRPHPFTAAGNREFNSFIWMPPNATAAAISCSPTRRSSRPCSEARRAWRTSGGTWHDETVVLLRHGSGWRDSNPRPLRPERSALPSCATPRLKLRQPIAPGYRLAKPCRTAVRPVTFTSTNARTRRAPRPGRPAPIPAPSPTRR